MGGRLRGALARQSMQGLVSGAGRQFRGPRTWKREWPESSWRRILPRALVGEAWRLDLACSVSAQEILKQGVAGLKPLFCSRFIFSPTRGR